MNATINIETLCQWSAPKHVNTRMGDRILRTAAPSDEFRRLFGSSAKPGPAQAQLKAAGLGWSKDQKTGEWQVAWWAPVSAEQAAKENAAIEASRATDAEIAIPAPEGLAYMPFQRAGIKFLSEHPAVLLADQMGLGKTVQAVGLINMKPEIKTVLVVCPASLKLNWRNELARWLTRPLRVGVQDAGQPWCGKGVDIVVLNYDILSKYPQIYAQEWDALIADECFVPGTTVRMGDGSAKPIEQVSPGDTVATAIGPRKVEATRSSWALELVRVQTVSGSYVCTPGHKFFTNKGWVEACLLTPEHYLKTYDQTMRMVRGELRALQEETVLRDSLLSEMEDETARSQSRRIHSRDCSEGVNGFEACSCTAPAVGKAQFRAYDQAQPDGELRNQSSDGANSEGNRSQAGGSQRERNRTNSSGVGVADSLSANQEQSRSHYSQGSRMSQPLQGGCCISGNTARGGMRRRHALRSQGQGNGPAEDPGAEGIGVVCVTVLKQEDFERYQRGCDRVAVYNLQVEGHPSYVLSNGAVVHNCHYVKNPKAQRTKLLLGSRRKGSETPGVRAKRRVFMTGTPLLNKPIELFPLLESLEPGKWTFKDRVRYCAGYQGRWGWDFSGAAHLDELQRRLRTSVMCRRLKSEVLTELPPKRRQIIELAANGDSDLVAEENNAYERHEREILRLEALKVTAELADDEQAYAAAAKALAGAYHVMFEEMAQVRHEVALAKVPKVSEHVINLLEETTKVVLFAHHLDVIAKYASALAEFNPLVITGETKQDTRVPMVTQFNDTPENRVLILGIKAAGVGLSVKASTEVFAELDWTPGVVAQAEDRCHGIGRGIEGEPLLVQHLVLEGSLDSRMVRTIVAKQEIADKALDKGAGLVAGSNPVTTVEVGSVMEEVRAEQRQQADSKTQALVPRASDELRALVHSGLKRLAGMDSDYAAVINGIGFNKFDGVFGHALAERSYLTDKMVWAGAKLVNKYRRQLGAEYAERLTELRKVTL